MNETNVTNSDGQSQQGTPTSSVIENSQVVAKLADVGVNQLSPIQAALIPAIISGADILASGPKRGRAIAFVAALAATRERDLTNRTIVIVDSEGDAERTVRAANDIGLATLKVGARAPRGGKINISNAVVLVGTTQGMLEAFDEGVLDGSRINRAILDGTEHGIQGGRIDELLNLLHDLQKTQIVYVKSDESINVSNFIKKFLKSPKEIQVSMDDVGPDAGFDAPQRPKFREQARDNNRDNNRDNGPAVAAEPPPPPRVKKVPANAEHLFIELPNDLLAKPNALTDLIEGDAAKGVVVFCGSPSEADLTDVMLRKRGITTRKLIGFVSPNRISSAVAALQSGEATALVITDIAARDVVLSQATLIVNYSTHADVAVYQQRAAIAEEGPTAVKVISLLTPVDLMNFNGIKKELGYEFKAATLPTKEELAKAKIKGLSAKAKEKALTTDERIKGLLSAILASENKDEILALLVSNTIDALPAALAQSQREPREEGDDRGGRDFDDRRGGRRGGRDDRRDDRRGGGRDRRDRGGRRGDRDGDSGYDAQGGENSYRAPEGEMGAEGGDENRSEQAPRQRREREPYVPPEKDVRLYVGHGSSEGISGEKITELLVSKCGFAPEQIKRTITRGLYTFVDVPEASADDAVTKLSEIEMTPGAKTFVTKAVMITSPREEKKEGAPAELEGSAPVEGGEAIQSDVAPTA